jgi:peptidoglycan hydrolase CwlO-like protein
MPMSGLASMLSSMGVDIPAMQAEFKTSFDALINELKSIKDGVTKANTMLELQTSVIVELDKSQKNLINHMAIVDAKMLALAKNQDELYSQMMRLESKQDALASKALGDAVSRDEMFVTEPSDVDVEALSNVSEEGTTPKPNSSFQ